MICIRDLYKLLLIYHGYQAMAKLTFMFEFNDKHQVVLIYE